MFADEIERAHLAARAEGVTMSEFIRQATIERTERTLQAAGDPTAASAA